MHTLWDYDAVGGRTRLSGSKLEDTADTVLVDRAREGDRDALCELLREYGPQVRASLDINPKWRSVLDLDDVMQVTYLEAFRNVSQLRGGAAAFGAWLRRIAVHNLRDAVDWLECERRPQPDRRLLPPPGQDSLSWLWGLATGSTATPGGTLASAEMRRFLEAEIAALPADYGRVLESVYLKGRSVAETARLLGRSRGAVHLLRGRALDCLRARLGVA